MTTGKGPQIRAKRAFGQNFLVDGSYIVRIVRGLHLSPDDTVLEIGAGRGALTEALLASGATVCALEIDRDLIPVLRERFSDRKNFKLVAADVLEVDLARLLDENSIMPPVKVVGNLPYNISTAILQILAGSRHLISEAVLMFQREVVDRINAAAGRSERGFYTVMTESGFGVTKLFDVPPPAFSPPPKGWSSVVALAPKPESVGDDPGFRRLVSMAFAQKRKTILNNLRQYSPNAESLLKDAGIDPRRRSETLTLDEWFTLFHKLK